MCEKLLDDMVDEVVEFDQVLYEKNVEENGALFADYADDGFGEPIGEQEEA